MKRFLLAVPAALLLSGCASAPAAVSVPDVPFSAAIGATYGGSEFTADLRRSSAGKWELTVTEPYRIEGLTMSLCGDETRLSMFGLEAPADVSGGAVSAAKAIAAAYDAAAGSPGTFTASDDGCTMSGTCELGAFTITIDKDGAPVSLSCDAAGLSAELSGFSPLPPTEIEAEIAE